MNLTAEGARALGFAPREGTNDLAVINGCVELNEYRLPDSLEGWTVLDVGAHVGAFAVACLRRGARRVVSFEPDPENYIEMIRVRNRLRIAKGTWETWLAACWRSDQGAGYLLFHTGPLREQDGTLNTGGGDVLEARDRLHPVQGYGLDHVVRMVTPVAPLLLKLDCEGSEWPILYTSNLAPFDRIVGEYHEFGGPHDQKAMPAHGIVGPDAGGARWGHLIDRYTSEHLEEFLTGEGFVVEGFRHQEPDGSQSRLGMFFADRVKA